jgi:hypothetical protein
MTRLSRGWVASFRLCIFLLKRGIVLEGRTIVGISVGNASVKLQLPLAAFL